MKGSSIYKYGDNKIVLSNSSKGIELIVNGEVQDKKSGMILTGDLKGTLPNGEKVKVIISGTFNFKFELYVGHQLLIPEID